MLRDDLLTDLVWGDLERVWTELASLENQDLVRDFVTALWKESASLSDPAVLSRILAATLILVGPRCELPDISSRDGEGAMT